MIVYIPSPLRSYTANKSQVEIVPTKTLAELLSVLEKQFPGIRFRMLDEQGRIRQHIKFFINRDEAKSLSMELKSNDVVHIMCALSGG